MSDAATGNLLLWVGVTSTALCLVSLSVSRLYRVVPAFAFYLAFVLAITVFSAFAPSQEAYWHIYLITSFIDYLCEFAVMYELASQVAAFLKKDAPQNRRTAGFISMVAIAGACILLAISVPFAHVNPQVKTLLRVDLAFDVFRALFFVGVLMLSLVFGMRWRHLPLKIAFCLSLYSFVALATRATQEYADRLTSVSTWFRFADQGPIITWSILMFMLCWQLARLPKHASTASPATFFIPGFRRAAKR